MTAQHSTENRGERPFGLRKQFLAMAAVVLALGMGSIGLWVTSEIEAVTDNAAAITALMSMASLPR